MKALAAAIVALFMISATAELAFADKASVHYKRGMAFKRTGNHDKAIAELESAVAINPKHGQAWATLGHLYKKKRNYPKAIDAYEHATQLLPKDPVLWSNLGMSYYRGQKVDDARVALEKACRLDPKNAEVHANLGAILRQKGDLKSAARNLRWAVKLDPKQAAYRNNLGLAYRVMGSRASEAQREKYYAAAVQQFKKAIEIDPNEPRYYFNTGVVYRRWEKVDDAIKYYMMAIDKEPGMHGAWYDLGYMHKLNHDNDKAIEAFTKYLQLTKGKDPKADQEVRDQIEALGGKPPKK